jgi:hypothetical protein
MDEFNDALEYFDYADSEEGKLKEEEKKRWLPVQLILKDLYPLLGKVTNRKLAKVTFSWNECCIRFKINDELFKFVLDMDEEDNLQLLLSSGRGKKKQETTLLEFDSGDFLNKEERAEVVRELLKCVLGVLNNYLPDLVNTPKWLKDEQKKEQKAQELEDDLDDEEDDGEYEDEDSVAYDDDEEDYLAGAKYDYDEYIKLVDDLFEDGQIDEEEKEDILDLAYEMIHVIDDPSLTPAGGKGKSTRSVKKAPAKTSKSPVKRNRVLTDSDGFTEVQRKFLSYMDQVRSHAKSELKRKKNIVNNKRTVGFITGIIDTIHRGKELTPGQRSGLAKVLNYYKQNVFGFGIDD